MSKVSVIGAGSWGTALAVLLCKNGHSVTMWSHRKSQVDYMNDTRKSDKLKECRLPDQLVLTDDLQLACQDAEVILMSVPSTATRATAEKMKAYVNKSQIFITVTKGIEESTFFTQTEILEDVLGEDFSVCVLSGPSHAEEVVVFKPTVVVAGSKNQKTALFVQSLFMNQYFRVYSSPDVKGIEVGAALKNVIALAAGMSDGLGFGDNAKAALITRGIKEISELAVSMGGLRETLSGLTGVGDLIVTCSSIHSRNRMAGYYMGQGISCSQAIDKVGMVVEGVNSAKAAYALAKKYDVDMPIVEQVNRVCFEGLSAKQAVYDLMTRDKKPEVVNHSWN